MTKYDLREYRYLRKEMAQLQDQIQSIRSLMLAPKNQVITGMPRGSRKSGDSIGEVLGRVEKLERRYTDKYNALLRKCEKIETVIEPLSCRERALIRYKYFQGLTWEQVALEMNYSVDNIYKMHGKILQKIKSVQ